MTTEEQQGIEEINVSFFSKQFCQNLKTHKQLLDTYKNSIQAALSLEGEAPIFLDTNVLLSVYEISFKAREKIKQFLKKYKDRIVICNQVQHEYIKNREKVINAFQSTVTEQIPRNFNSNVINQFTSFRNANKSKLEDYSEIQEQLEKLEKAITKFHEKLKEEVNDKIGTADMLLLEDDFLDILSTIKTTTVFGDSILKKIKNDYEKLLPIYKSTLSSKKDDEEKAASKENYSLSVFPGCAEKGDKDDPTGDFIIYHELMHYALENKTDVIFLTNDTTKGDWLRKDGKVHLHYLDNFYYNTGQIIYIINAERLFVKLFKDVSFESLIPEEEHYESARISLQTLKAFINDFDLIKKYQYKDEDVNIAKLAEELELNEIIYIEQLQTLLQKSSTIIHKINPYYDKRFNRIGIIRMTLKIILKDYFYKLEGVVKKHIRNSTDEKLYSIYVSANK